MSFKRRLSRRGATERSQDGRIGMREGRYSIREEEDQPMQVATGTVVDGKVVVDGLDLTEGQVVTILTRETDEKVYLSPEEEAELLEAIAEADRGETISPEELFERLERLS